MQDEIWSLSPDTLIATSLAFPAGRGRKVEGGYEVSGRWPLSSGVDNSDWNMLAFMVRELDDGPPVDQRFALVHRSQYEIIDTWHAVGLSGTGSKDVAIKGLFVPEQRTVTAWAMNGKPHPGSKVNDSALFRLPMLALGPYVLSGVMLGCAQGAYETVVGAARKRNATTTGQPVGASASRADQGGRSRCAHRHGGDDDASGLRARDGQSRAPAASPLHEDKLRYRRDALLLGAHVPGGRRHPDGCRRLERTLPHRQYAAPVP